MSRARDSQSPVVGDPTISRRSAITDADGHAECWSLVREGLRGALGADRLERWFGAVEFQQEPSGDVVLGVANLFIRDWIEQRYLATVTNVVATALGEAHFSGQVRLKVMGKLYREFRREEARFRTAGDTAETAGPCRDESASGPAGGGRVSATDPVEPSLAGLNRRLTLGNFVVGSCNHVAFQAGLDVLRRPGVAYSPLFIYGGSGLGKTHLVQGLTREFFRQGCRQIRYLPCEGFANQFIRALKNHSMERFRSRMHSLKALVIDDVQVLAGKVRTQEALLHAIDDISATGGQVILASDTRPQGIRGLKEQLQGRFVTGLVCRLERPDFATRLAILEQDARQVQVSVPAGVLRCLAETYDRNVRELHGAFVKVVAVAALTHEPLDETRVAEILADQGPQTGVVTLRRIVEDVARHFGLEPDALLSRSRVRTLSAARQVAVYVSRVLTEHSLVEIGEFFGGRNHSTVNFAFRKVIARMRKDAAFQRQVEGMVAGLREGS